MDATILSKPVTADDIQWHLSPIQHIERLDALGLTEAETTAYVHDLQIDLESMRTTLYVALADNARLTRLVKQQTAAIRKKNDIIRTQDNIIRRLMEPMP